jgi:hypothetical protein
MFTRAGTNGVDKSFSSGSCGETGDLATSEMRFPQRVRACRKRITTSTGKRNFRIVGGDDRFAPRRFPKARDCRGRRRVLLNKETRVELSTTFPAVAEDMKQRTRERIHLQSWNRK